MLVSFQPNLTEQASSDAISELDETKGTSQRHINVLVRRAVECGLQLLARLSHYRVYLTAEERTKHRNSVGEIDRHQARGTKGQRFNLFEGSQSSSSDDQNSNSDTRRDSSRNDTPLNPYQDVDSEYVNEYSVAFDIWNCIPFLKRRKNRQNKVNIRRPSEESDSSGPDLNAIDLELHIAVSCGDITNVVIGEMEPDTSTRNSGGRFPNGLSGGNTSNSSKRESNRFSRISAKELDAINSYFLEYTGRLEYAICGPAVESLEDSLSAAKAGEMSITPEVYDLIRKQSIDLTFEKRKQFYIVKNKELGPSPTNKVGALRHHHGGQHHPKTSDPNAGYLAVRPELQKQASKLNIEPLIPRVRNQSHLYLSNEMNLNYYKYVNRSALYRLQNSPDGNFPAQFRDVTVMFVSLGQLNVATAEGLEIAQHAAVVAMQLLVKYEGKLPGWGDWAQGGGACNGTHCF